MALVAGYAYGATPNGASALFAAVVVGSVAITCALVGGLGGFLFGIPRLLARSGPVAAPSDAQAAGGEPADMVGIPDASRSPKPLRGNSNLEEISDWVTKILVGLGLVNAGKVADMVGAGASHVAAQGLKGTAGADMVVLSLGLSSFLLSFLFLYLQTRTRITLMLFATEGVQEEAALPTRAVEAANEARITADQDGGAMATAMTARIGNAREPAAPVAADRDVLRALFDALRSPEEFAAWGAAQARAGNLEAAETALRRANALSPGDPRVLRRLAELRALRGDWRGAVELLEEARAKTPGNWRIWRQELLLSLYLPPLEGFRRAQPLADMLA